MPKQNEKGRKKIEIAKPKMTLSGFEHDPKQLKKKARLLAEKKSEEVEVAYTLKSSIKAATADLVSSEADSDEQRESDIEELPMNEDIEVVPQQSE